MQLKVYCTFFHIWKTFICSQHFLSLRYNVLCCNRSKKADIISQKKSIACQHLVSFGIIVMLYFTTTVLYLVRGWDPLSIKERGCQQGRISKIIIVLSLMLSLYHHGHSSQRMLACKCKKGEVKYQSHKLVSN